MTDLDYPYDALLIVSFGGPEGMDDVIPFLENVTRGRNIPPDRLAEVAHHYEQFGGVSPHNQQIRDLIAALQPQLDAYQITLPLYWGNRNWHPMLTDTMTQMARDGVKRALAFIVSAYSSYSSCRQYLENIEAARKHVADIDDPDLAPPVVDKIRAFYNHPGFIEAMQDRMRHALQELPIEHREQATLLFTAHSIPMSMADHCAYVAQLREACRLVSQGFQTNPWELVYQSRSGPPSIPWLEPDVCDHLDHLKTQGVHQVVIAPIGFLSDHLEVLFDLDIEAAERCEQLGITMMRAGTAGTHPSFVKMIVQLIEERLTTDEPRQRLTMGSMGIEPDFCPADCCPAPVRPARTGSADKNKSD